MVQAANINAASRVAAATIGAGGKGPKSTLGSALPVILISGASTLRHDYIGLRTQADMMLHSHWQEQQSEKIR